MFVKRGTPEHPKTKRLCTLLRKPNYAGVGILESLWHLVARYTPDGAIGRLADHEIAQSLDWRGDPTNLIDALVAAGWLERCTCHRLYVHDWKDHADQTVQRVLKKRKQWFIEHDASIKLVSLSLKPIAIAIANTVPALPSIIPALPEISWDGFDFSPWFETLYALGPKKAYKNQTRQVMASDRQMEDAEFRATFEAKWREWSTYMAMEYHPKRTLLEWFNDEGWKDDIPKSTTESGTAQKVLEAMKNNASR